MQGQQNIKHCLFVNNDKGEYEVIPINANRSI